MGSSITNSFVATPCDAVLERGVCEEDEMFQRFDALERSYEASH
jgi:hypothetical protein